jgi:PAS domain S-box-containing protein
MEWAEGHHVTVARVKEVTDRPITILLVEDNPGDVCLLQELLKEVSDAPFILTSVERLDGALAYLAEKQVDVILLDLSLPDSQGLETFTKIHDRASATPIVVLTGLDRETLTHQVMQAGAQDYLVKGQVHGTLLMRSMRYAIERKRAEEALRRVKDELELRVAERTAELISSNSQLQLELEERKQIEESLRISQARFAGILEIADDAIISVDAHQRITLFNQGAEKIFGYMTQEVLGQSLDLLLPGRFTKAHRQHVVDFTQTSGKARKMGDRQEIFGRRKDGTEFPAEASISRLNVGGEQVFTTILRDISDRKQAEEALEQLSRQNELILNSVGEGLCGVDVQGKTTFINPAAAKLLGYSVEELLGQSIEVLLPSHKADGTTYALEVSPLYDALHAALRKGLVHQGLDEIFRHKNGSIFPVEYICTPIQEQGAIVGVVIAFKDITERQMVERMKDEFVSVVSHELRTPLTSIHGALRMLSSGLLDSQPAKGKRLLDIAVDSTDRLVRLTNDILDVQRIKSGKVTMEKKVCYVADLLTQAVDVMQAMADKAGITLSVGLVSARLWVDADRIMQTLTNLLSNAIKFSPSGATVWLMAKEQENHILFQIKDQGRGIPGDKLESIFERFQQVDSSDARNHEGTGLGLAICRSIVQQHDGQIWAESTLGEGSTFSFTLPLYRPEVRHEAHSSH